MKRINKMVRTWTKGYNNNTTDLNKALEDGWVVKMATPFNKDNDTLFVEYILEKVVED